MASEFPMLADGESACRRIFLILFGQLIFLVLWSFLAQSGPVFVQRIAFGFDFREFYYAGLDWLHHANPYLRTRFFTPPPSVLIGVVLGWLSPGIAALAFFAANLAIILFSVRACSRKLELSAASASYLTGIAALFYPVYFLLDRGNLEALVLGCLCWALCTRNRILRGALVALAAGLKLYPLLLLLPAARNRRWRFILLTLVALVLLLLPFYRLFSPFLHAVLGREAMFHRVENISPAAIIVAVAGMGLGRWIFFAYWVATLAVTLYRQRQSSVESLILPFLPWTVAFPLQVYPYGGVLLLPVLAWKLREMKDRKPDLSDSLFINGFLLVGIQATAFTVYFQSGVPALLNGATADGTAPAHPIFHWMNSLGMCLILVAVALSRKELNRAPQADRGTEAVSQLELVSQHE